MFTLLVIAGGLLIGWFRKGSLWNITNVKFRIIWLLPCAYILQYVSIFHMHGLAYEVSILLSYLGLIVFCLVNFRIAGIKWALVGTAANLLVMAVNGLRMPAYMPEIRRIAPQIVPALLKGDYMKSVAMSSHTHLNPLGDIFNVSLITPNLVSVGDWLFSFGIIIFLQYAMRSSVEVKQTHAAAKSS